MCRELESWYFGDLKNTAEVLGKKSLVNLTNKKAYRDPDHIIHPAKELSRLTEGTYGKLAHASPLGQKLSVVPENNTSASYRAFVNSLQRLVSTEDDIIP